MRMNTITFQSSGAWDDDTMNIIEMCTPLKMSLLFFSFFFAFSLSLCLSLSVSLSPLGGVDTSVH